LHQKLLICLAHNFAQIILRVLHIVETASGSRLPASCWHWRVELGQLIFKFTLERWRLAVTVPIAVVSEL